MLKICEVFLQIFSVFTKSASRSAQLSACWAYSAVRAASRDKHTPLNQSVPLEIPFFDGQSSCFGAMAGENPEDLIIGRERVQDALSDVRKQLSDFSSYMILPSL